MSNKGFVNFFRKNGEGLRLYYKKQRAIFHLRKCKTIKHIKDSWESDDAKATKKAIAFITLDGILISALFYYFIGFQWLFIPVFGMGWYFLKNQALKELRQILASVNIVKIGR